MRILVLSDLYPPVSFGGYEMECASVVEHLGTAHEVVVLTSRRGRADARKEGHVLRELPYSGARSQLLAPAHAHAAVRTMRRVLDDTRPEFIFIWNATAIPTAAIAVVAASGVPLAHRLCERWFAERGILADHFVRYLAPGHAGLRGAWARAARLVNRYAGLRLDPTAPYRAALSYNSEALRRAVGVPPGVVPVLERVIHPATASARLFASLPRRPADRPTILFVGRLSPQKGADIAVRALAELERRHGIVADLVMAGPADRRARSRVRVESERFEVATRVRIVGQLDPQQLGRALQRAHALVVPSRAEAFGLVCVEGAAARVPVVAARVDGIPEALREDEHAVFFPADDAAGCAAALAETLSDSPRTQHRVERAFARAKELSLDRYLVATDRFLADATAAFDGGHR